MAVRNESEKLAESLHSAAIRLLRSVRRADEAGGLTASRLSALSVIVFRREITLGELADAEQVRPPTMTRIVNALEEQQYIKKSADEKDGRLIRIAATAKGKRELISGRARRVQLLAGQIRSVGAAEQEKLSAALKTIEKIAARME